VYNCDFIRPSTMLCASVAQRKHKESVASNLTPIFPTSVVPSCLGSGLVGLYASVRTVCNSEPPLPIPNLQGAMSPAATRLQPHGPSNLVQNNRKLLSMPLSGVTVRGAVIPLASVSVVA